MTGRSPLFLFRSLPAVLAVIMTAISAPNDAVAAPYYVCKQYAEQALAQNRENMNRNCGYRGRRWSFHYQGHFNWCRGVKRGVAWSEALNRMNALQRCKEGGAVARGHGTDASCRRYANTAVRQNSQNIRQRCGYRGARWSGNWQGHYRWCRGVPYSHAGSETLARGTALRRCSNRRPRASACAWRRFSNGWGCACVFTDNPNVTRRVNTSYCRGIRRLRR